MEWNIEVERRVVGFLRSGGFAWVASEAAGVPYKEFRKWFLGAQRSEGGRGSYVTILQARAEGRLGAEVTMRTKNPAVWLRYGPGRYPPTRPGWGAKVQMSKRSSGFGTLDVCQWIERIMTDLLPFPDARSSVVRSMESAGADCNGGAVKRGARNSREPPILPLTDA